jgi:hypothetical protein
VECERAVGDGTASHIRFDPPLRPLMPTLSVVLSWAVLFVVFYGSQAMNVANAADERDISHALGEINVKSLTEISGMAASGTHSDTLWLINDGDAESLFAVSTSGSLVALVTFSGDVDDVEDVAIGPGPKAARDYLYLGDIGDNDSERRDVRVVRFAEPELTDERGQQIRVEDAETFRIAYPDGPHDAETLFVDSRDRVLCIVTKEDSRARLYTVPIDELSAGGRATLTKAGKLDVEKVSAGAISADGGYVLLRWEKQGWLWHRRDGESVADALQRNPTEVPVLGKRQGKNGEAVCFAPAGRRYFTVSEGKNATIYAFDLPDAGADER